MAHISRADRSVRARFIKNKDDKILIEFADPAYTKSESILFNPKNKSVHAVMHEGLFLLGHVPDDIVTDFTTGKSIELCADHYDGKILRLHAQISILKH